MGDIGKPLKEIELEPLDAPAPEREAPSQPIEPEPEPVREPEKVPA